jgi:hypothetical protein
MLGTSQGNIFGGELGVARPGSPSPARWFLEEIPPSNYKGEIGRQTLGKLKADTGFSSVIVFASPIDPQEIHFVGCERVIYSQGCWDKSFANDPVTVGRSYGEE